MEFEILKREEACDSLNNMTNRILIFNAGIPPIDKRMPASGDGIRAWQVYQGLKTQGFEVHLSILKGTYNKFRRFVPDEFGNIAFYSTKEGQNDIIQKVQPDILLFTHWPTILIEDIDIPVIIDFHGPHVLERYFQGYRTPDENIREKLYKIRMGDFFTCAGEYQKYYFIAWLLSAGVISIINRKIVSNIPISLSPDLPPIDYDKKLEDTIKFVYGGMFLPWQDPFNAFKVMSEVLNKKDGCVFEIFGGKHPTHQIDAKEFDEYVKKTKTTPNVKFRGLIPRYELLEEYKKAHVALDLMNWNLERELAFTTRTVEYLWAGLPVIYNNYAELSEYIKRYKAGWCVDPENPEEIREVIEQILDDPEQLVEYSMNARKLVKDNFTWDKTIKPLADFCKNPKKRDRNSDIKECIYLSQEVIKTNRIRRAIQCYKDYGIKYTTRKTIEYLKGDMH